MLGEYILFHMPRILSHDLRQVYNPESLEGTLYASSRLTFYQGASLPDPDMLFNNELEGKQWRTIDLFKDDQINESSLKVLLRAAVESNKVKAAVATPQRVRLVRTQ